MHELSKWGWRPFFQSQLDLVDLTEKHPARVIAVHRDRIEIVGPDVNTSVPPVGKRGNPESYATVGDWVLYDPASGRARGPLERLSLMKRQAAGREKRVQLIAANLDTLFITASANQDFSIARIERYLALAYEAGVTPVIILTKIDLADDNLHEYQDTLRALDPNLPVIAVNARQNDARAQLAPWLAHGQVLALVGSSGVGKSTLVNTLSGVEYAPTQGIRDIDDKGRHTTTHRAMYQLPDGAWLIDTPGMREIQLTEAEQGVEAVFDDILDLVRQCRFSDCRHESEPGCAVKAALETGALDPERYARWQKLEAEDALNSATLKQKRDKDKAFGKTVKAAKKQKKTRR